MDNLEVLQAMKEINTKLDRLRILVENMYMLSIFGKRTGLEEKALNSARATFMIEKQYKEILCAIGRESLEESDEVEKLKSRCEDVVEYILNAYDGILPTKAEFMVASTVNEEPPKESTEEEEGVVFTGEDMDDILRFMGGAR